MYAKAKVPVTIESSIENITIDVIGGPNPMAGNGNGIGMYTTSGTANQQFILVPAGPPDSYHIQSVDSGKFLHIGGAIDAKESVLLLWEGANSTSPQTIFKATADANGFIHFITTKGFSFDLKGGATASGTVLWLWDNHGGAGQAFYVMAAANPASLPPAVVRHKRTAAESLDALAAYAKAQTPVIVQMKEQNFAWDLKTNANGDAPSRNPILFYPTTGVKNQQWIFEATDIPNAYRIRTMVANRYVAITDLNDVQGSPLFIHDIIPNVPGFTFNVMADNEGFFHIFSANVFAFDLEGGVYKNGQKLWLWTNNNSVAQSFYITPVAEFFGKF